MSFRFTTSTRVARSSSLASCGAPPCWSFSAGPLHAWWLWRLCGSAHHWGREITALGHEVKLIPPAHVKPYIRRNKTDAADAAAICEAALRPQQRFAPLRTVDNQAELIRHRVREQLVSQRTASLNALRGHLSEIGVIAPQGAPHAYRLKRLAEGDADDNGEIVACEAVRAAPAPLAKQIDALDEAIAAIDKELETAAKADEKAKRLMTIPGIGPVTATAIAATVRDLEAFASGRAFAAFLGLTPRRHSTGGKQRSGGVSKMGDRYLRKLLVVGATAVLHHAAGRSDALRRWAKEMLRRKAAHKSAFKLTAVALANKLAASSMRSCVRAGLTIIVPLRGAPEGGCLWFICERARGGGPWRLAAGVRRRKPAPKAPGFRRRTHADDDNLFAERRWKSRVTEG